MTAKHWFVVFFLLIFLGPPAVFFVVEGFYNQFLESPGAAKPGLAGVLFGGVAVAISIPLFLLAALISAMFALMRRGMKPPAADNDSGAVLSSDADKGSGR